MDMPREDMLSHASAPGEDGDTETHQPHQTLFLPQELPAQPAPRPSCNGDSQIPQEALQPSHAEQQTLRSERRAAAGRSGGIFVRVPVRVPTYYVEGPPMQPEYEYAYAEGWGKGVHSEPTRCEPIRTNEVTAMAGESVEQAKETSEALLGRSRTTSGSLREELEAKACEVKIDDEPRHDQGVRSGELYANRQFFREREDGLKAIHEKDVQS